MGHVYQIVVCCQFSASCCQSAASCCRSTASCCQSVVSCCQYAICCCQSAASCCQSTVSCCQSAGSCYQSAARCCQLFCLGRDRDKNTPNRFLFYFSALSLKTLFASARIAGILNWSTLAWRWSSYLGSEWRHSKGPLSLWVCLYQDVPQKTSYQTIGDTDQFPLTLIIH